MLKTLKPIRICVNAFLPLGLVFTALSASSCSSLVESTRKSLLGSDRPRKDRPKEVKWVSKAQYDALMDRYKDLNDKYEKLKDDKIDSGQAGFDQVGEMGGGQPLQLQRPRPSTFLRTMGLLSRPLKTRQALQSLSKISILKKLIKSFSTTERPVALKENGKSDESLKIFQYLERSSTEQIRVRSRAQIGQIYMEKGQYDLALQVWEKIIHNDAFSSKVLDASRGRGGQFREIRSRAKKTKIPINPSGFF